MKDAGIPATRGQRARMAGAYLTYATMPLFGALALNKVGNLVDSDVPQ